MVKMWVAPGLLALCAMLSAPAPVSAQPSVCDLLPFLPFCDDEEDCCADLEDRVADLEQNQVVQNAAIASLAAQVANINTAIGELQACCDDNAAAIDDLQDQIDQIVDFLGGDCAIAGLDECDGACTDTATDRNNCGECGNVCAANQDCVNGACVLKTCPPAGACQVAVLNQDGSCTNVPLTGPACDDGLDCTTDDSCLNGTCVGGGNPCDVGETCVEGSGDPPTCI